MYYFTTLFDSRYLSRGMVMLESLQRYCKDFHIYIFAFDDLCYKILESLKPEHTTIIPLNEFETDELLKIKTTRTKAEYCWTCTPSTIFHILTRLNIPNCTYIDADLKFFSDPSVLIEEMMSANKTVLITDHRFSRLPEFFERKRAGQFCVQFVTFMNDPESIKVLDRWRLQCIDWCYARYEDGKFGDQKYLEEWPARYNNIHILNHQGGGLAPWNADQYTFTEADNKLTGYVKKNRTAFEPVFYHFQYVRFLSGSSFDVGWYRLPESVRRYFYFPYLEQVMAREKFLREYNSNYKTTFFNGRISNIKDLLKTLFKKSTNYNILKLV